jgi:hypothetical protein
LLRIVIVIVGVRVLRPSGLRIGGQSDQQARQDEGLDKLKG